MARITARTVAKIRNTVAGMLADTCDLQRENFVRGNMGERLHVFETYASAQACRVIRAGANNREMEETAGNQDNIMERFRVIIAYDGVIEAGNRVITGGKTYEVRAIEQRLSDAAYISLICTRVSE